LENIEQNKKRILIARRYMIRLRRDDFYIPDLYNPNL